MCLISFSILVRSSVVNSLERDKNPNNKDYSGHACLQVTSNRASSKMSPDQKTENILQHITMIMLQKKQKKPSCSAPSPLTLLFTEHKDNLAKLDDEQQECTTKHLDSPHTPCSPCLLGILPSQPSKSPGHSLYILSTYKGDVINMTMEYEFSFTIYIF